MQNEVKQNSSSYVAVFVALSFLSDLFTKLSTEPVILFV